MDQTNIPGRLPTNETNYLSYSIPIPPAFGSRPSFCLLVGGAAIVGFNPDERSWITQDNTARPFDRLPKLDGALLQDEESRRAIAMDQGNMFHRVPAAVLRPGSVQDIVAMVRYANRHKLKVAIRGDGHSRYGQTQAEAGLVIDSRSLNAVSVRTPHSADAQLGAFWSAVADATLPKGLTPRLFPGTCLALITIGGTLSAGGIGSPFITMWIPASATRGYLDNILSLTPEAAALVPFQGVEQFGCYPLNTRRFTRPLFKVPSEEQAFAFWLFRSVKAGDEAALSALLASNRELLAKMTAVGGKRYAPYSMVISPAEWQAHYGPEVWPVSWPPK
jgi:hypothetical protein